jgi:rubrerythrin
MSTTIDNLKTAFAGESQANRKYLAFAKKAEKEGYPQIAKLFRAAAEAETIHALAHFQSMDGVGSTADNLKAAVAGETYEYTEMYPPMVSQAEKEGHKGKTMLRFAGEVERIHAGLFQRALERIGKGTDLDGLDIYICPVCGDLEIGTLPDKCPVCGAPASRFQKMS